MNTEPTDLRLPRRPATPRGPMRPSTAIDGAFASLTEADLRIDQSTTAQAKSESTASSDDSRIAPELVESLRGQLAAIEAQQGTLQRLLDSLEG